MEPENNPGSQADSGSNGQTIPPIGNSDQSVPSAPSQPSQPVTPVQSAPSQPIQPGQPIPPNGTSQPVVPSSSYQGVQAEQPNREGQWLKSDNLNQQSFYVEENVKAENKKKILRKVLAIVLPLFLFFILSGGGLGAYFLFVKSPSPEKLLKETLKEAMSTDVKNVYLSLDINAINEKYTGELKGDISGEESKMKFELGAKTYFDLAKQEPVDIKLEVIEKRDKEDEDGHMRFTSISSPVREVDYYTKYIFGGVIEKWIEFDYTEAADTNTDNIPSFREEGGLASLYLIDPIIPMGNYNEKDQKNFFDLAEKYNLYKTSEEVEESLFKGIDARKIDITISKDSLKELQNEAKQTLPEESGYQTLDSSLLDEIFGASNEMVVELYVKKDKPKLIGINYQINLSQPIEAGIFQASIQKITTNIFIEYDRELILDMPQSYLTEEEFQNSFNFSL